MDEAVAGKQLRALAKDYSLGQLSRSDYKEQRYRLIEEYCNNKWVQDGLSDIVSEGMAEDISEQIAKEEAERKAMEAGVGSDVAVPASQSESTAVPTATASSPAPRQHSRSNTFFSMVLIFSMAFLFGMILGFFTLNYDRLVVDCTGHRFDCFVEVLLGPG